jgi:ABC-type transporter Mla subunit MlaD
VTSQQQDRHVSASTMHQTAEALERSEAILHESAERSPDEVTMRRLHRLGDEVTRQAEDIDRRADAIESPATEPT